MSIVNSSKAFLLKLYRVKLLRFVIIFFAALFLLYVILAYTLVPFFLTKAIKDNYLQATGHHLQSDAVLFSPFKSRLAIHNLKDSANLWQSDSVVINLRLLESIRLSALVIDEVNIGQLVANPRQLENGSWNFDDVAKHIDAVNKKARVKKSATSNNAPVIVKKIVIHNAAINSNSLELNNLALVISPLNITVKNIDLRGKNLATIALKANVNEMTPLEIKGNVDLQSLHAELDIDISAIPFVWFNSALKPYAALEVLDGSIETRSHISISDGAVKNIVTSGKLTDFKLRPVKIEEDIIKWKNLAWQDAVISLNEKSAKVPLLSLDEFDGQFIIHKDRTNNIQAMIVNSEAANTAPINSSVAAAPEPAAAPWKFAIDRLAINNAAIGFNDQSLTPSFLVIVQQFSGDITNIANDDQVTAKINLAGNVDGTAPVSLSGEAKPFMAIPQADVLFSFEKIDMGALSPYSAEYAGWRIKKGLLSVDLHYRYDKGLIVGKNHVVIEHLVFGEKVRSPRALDIPLRLGLALLTDENGVAVLDAEISGDPKNPAFNVGEVLTRALRNTFKKIISSPFRFLSKLINSNEDLGRIEFTPGESQLSEQAISKLKLLQEALKKRPQMRLSVQGIYDAKMDVAALKEEQVKSELQKQGATSEDNRSRNASWEQAVARFYQAQGLINTSAAANEKFVELTSLQLVSPERLSRLAHERALAVKQHFVLQLNMPSDAILLNSDVSCVLENKCSGSAVVFTLEH
ncbi:MAG: DUF748 domain-containing protein [Pseudomonadota bacterium]